jgi:peptidoglycan/xylan/chitin deacetylase (PgdA/CDA1 family)
MRSSIGGLLSLLTKEAFAHLGKQAARTFLHDAGGLIGVRHWNRHSFRILMYHTFPSIPGEHEALAKQCAHMVRYYHPVSLTDIHRSLRDGVPLPPNSLAVTVDDGYHDFLTNAYPVFKDYKIPVTVFLISGFLDGHLWLWWDQVRYLITHSPRNSFAWAPPGRPTMHCSLETAAEREMAIIKTTETMKNVPNAVREEVLLRLPNFLGGYLPTDPPPAMTPLSWSEVRQLAGEGVEFGAHTVTHPILSRIERLDALFHEITQSKNRIEHELNREVAHFCYPNGRGQDFNEQTLRVVKQCGFRTASTTLKGLNGRGANAYELKRFGVWPTMPELYFAEMLAGLHDH